MELHHIVAHIEDQRPWQHTKITSRAAAEPATAKQGGCGTGEPAVGINAVAALEADGRVASVVCVPVLHEPEDLPPPKHARRDDVKAAVMQEHVVLALVCLAYDLQQHRAKCEED